jgi:formylmethanofuran dehydrogenase subunit E
MIGRDPIEHQYEEYKFKMKKPICAKCGERITHWYGYHINGEWFCPLCTEDAKTWFDEDDEEDY